MSEEPEPYHGPFVVLAPDPLGYRVSVDPANDPDLIRTYRMKNDAWAYARDLWTTLRAPLRDLTESNTARAAEK
ncbi:hypothetical protein H9L14_01955 [Sphingomonas sediminicola]|uniref:Uncharacterized protein n=1 Tax=Sphingomonas sediminicola TaxID=386874 RepID=A0ABX6T892_9SPHN|nr:hypothetical protein [Sphingomonas sediminicola]QNP46061.1 hypothetical protein H9L14_01955 [Sphingomonas sediminicola]